LVTHLQAHLVTELLLHKRVHILDLESHGISK
jgi:hypothetical protein